MDYRQLFSDDEVRQEFLDRFDEIAAGAAALGGFESMDAGLTVDRAAEAVERMAEGAWGPDGSGLEAIVERFTRPVHLVQRSTFRLPPDGLPTSAHVTARLERARRPLERAIPSVGRVELRNHAMQWAGTGWMVGPRLAVTNRHVAEIFAREARTGEGTGFAFKQSWTGRTVRADLDWYQEYQQPEESRFRVTEVAWIEPDSRFDVALLRIAATGEDGGEPPAPIELDPSGARTGRWVAVIGYPARDSRADPDDQQRIFDGVYGCKRLAGGKVTAVRGKDIVHHDATTLGGNSGSAVIDLDSGKAVALHFRGLVGERNVAVHAAAVARIVHAHGR
ncbi:trypsin-like serine peptidase [Streptomyces aureus]|uniref:trypsin-like serine peptidase n=1 Tax=Streptomyces aureus TaxID=193461 RepID=UPI0006E38C79|nr:serine protease [Streptomyces aureus]